MNGSLARMALGKRGTGMRGRVAVHRSPAVERRHGVAWILLALACSVAAPTFAQDTVLPQLQNEMPSFERRRRLSEIDRLLVLRNLERAEALLEQLSGQGAQDFELLTRRIQLAQLQDDHEQAVLLCREALGLYPERPRVWRDLAASLMALEQDQEAEAALQKFIDASPDRRSGMMVAMELWEQNGKPERALAFCDSARVRLREPRFMARQRARSLLALNRPQEAGDELIAELRDNPLNLPLIRTDLLDVAAHKEQASHIIGRLRSRAGETGSVPGERVLAADLQLLQGDWRQALDTVGPLLENRAGAVALLQAVATLAREAPLTTHVSERRAMTEFMLETLQQLTACPEVEPGLRPRVLDILAQVCEDALSAEALAGDPEQALARFERLLLLVKEGHPQSAHLYSAQIRLADYRRDVLRQPEQAAASLERLLTDLDLPVEGVALARLNLGECYLAAGDTARGRLVLTRLGHSHQFRRAAGHAHFHLARLDLAEGHWETARDRFATVAMDNPMASYANDALELGLAIAQELDNPTGGPVILNLYARSVLFDLTAQADSQRVALQDFVSEAAPQLSTEEPQHLLERGRYELAGLYARAGMTTEALEQCDQVVLNHPDGRFPAAALDLRGRILTELGRAEEARQTYERLLVQYPDYLFADDIRDQLRSLP